MNYELVINGYDHAWRREVGCRCERCRRVSHTANTSISLFGYHQHQLQFHALFDAGAGVADSLLQIEDLQKKPRLDWVFLTHWHPDHVADLARISTSVRRGRERLGLPAHKGRLWVREGSATWLERQQPHALRDFHVISSLEYLPKGQLLEPVAWSLFDLQIQPITLAHSSADLHAPHMEERLSCCAGFILESANFKAALLWDMDTTNLWLEQPNELELEAFEALQNCDLLFVDCNTWEYHQDANGNPASHASFMQIARIARQLKPRQTFLMHISGHEDLIDHGFGWSDDRWQLEANRIWQEQGLLGSVHVPFIGQRIALSNQLTEARELSLSL
jgi:ribonuclease BN (tRNA processing enzyme)